MVMDADNMDSGIEEQGMQTAGGQPRWFGCSGRECGEGVSQRRVGVLGSGSRGSIPRTRRRDLRQVPRGRRRRTVHPQSLNQSPIFP
jgi:hypothetical protein